MHIVVSIVGFRNSSDIANCLEALSRSTYQDFEVLICENGGRDAYVDLLAAIPTTLTGGQMVKVIPAPNNLGFAGGINVCLAQTPEADGWWLLNPDTEPGEGALSAMVERLARGDCEAVGCTVFLPNGKIQSHGCRWLGWLARGVLIGDGEGADEAVDASFVERTQSFISGASMLIGRRFLEVVGPMREEYFLYCEEVEWCLRALSKGMRLGFSPGARVLHHHGTTTGAGRAVRDRPRTMVYLSERNRLLLTRDCFGIRFPYVALATFAQLILRCAPRGAWRHFGYGFAGWWAGIRDERGAPRWIPV